MTLILDMQCQENTASNILTDLTGNNSPSFTLASSNYSVASGPGGSLARSFSGTLMESGTEIITLSPAITLARNAGAIEFFAKRTAIANKDGIVVKSPAGIEFNTTGAAPTTLRVTFDDGGFVEWAVMIDTTRWHHYSIVLGAGNTVKLYIDTVLSSTLASTSTFTVQFVGSMLDYFHGTFCGFRVYNTEINASQVVTDAAIGGLGLLKKIMQPMALGVLLMI